MQTLKKLLWYAIAESIFSNVRDATLSDETFLRNIKNGRNATIHLRKKHFPIIVRKVVNDMLKFRGYSVTSMKYHFFGMDIFISQN